MSVALALLGYAAVLGVLGPRLLTVGDWAMGVPRWAIAGWLALLASFFGALLAAAVALAVPSLPLTGNVAELLRSCVRALQLAYATPGGAAAAGTGLVLGAGICGRLAWCLARQLLAARRAGREHVAALAPISRRDEGLGVLVVQAPVPAAYCVTGRRSTVVVSTAALGALEPAQLAGVLAHERAHLDGRHHLVLALVDAAASAFPRVPLLSAAQVQVRTLVELAADDVAARGVPPLSLAAALVALASAGAHPAGALAAANTAALLRVQRLVRPGPALGGPPRARAVVGTGLLLVVPFVLLAIPALGVAQLTGGCPLPDASGCIAPPLG